MERLRNFILQKPTKAQGMREWLRDTPAKERNTLLSTPFDGKIALFHAIGMLDVDNCRVLLQFYDDKDEDMILYLFAGEYLFLTLGRRIEKSIVEEKSSWGITDEEWSKSESILYMLSCHILINFDQLCNWTIWNKMQTEIEEARRYEVAARFRRRALMDCVNNLFRVPIPIEIDDIFQRLKQKVITIRTFLQLKRSRWYRDASNALKKPHQTRDYALWMRSIPGRIKRAECAAFENLLLNQGDVEAAISLEPDACLGLLRPTIGALELDEDVHKKPRPFQELMREALQREHREQQENIEQQEQQDNIDHINI